MMKIKSEYSKNLYLQRVYNLVEERDKKQAAGVPYISLS